MARTPWPAPRLLPDRLTKAAVLVGLAPRGAEGLDWYDGMTQSNVSEHTAAANGYEGLAAMTEAAALTPSAPIRRACWPACSRRCPTRTGGWWPTRGIRAMLLQTYAEALRTSADGWIDDALAFYSPWGFDPATVTVPVLLWHGAIDNLSPVSHAMWLARPDSPAPRWSCRRARRTSARWTCCRTSCAGCRGSANT